MTQPSPVPAPVRLSRRGLLQGAGVLGAGALLGAGPARAGVPTLIARAGEPVAKNLIFMVADGMSAGVPALADHLGRYTGKGLTHLTRLAMGKGVHRSFCSTHCADGVVTDSAAASSAWSTGVKHRTGTLCQTPDGQAMTPLLVRAKQAGKRVGCVTTTSITHATPAGWYASHPSRDAEKDIGAQLLQRDVDVALGGGARFFDPGLATSNGLHVVRTRDELLKLGASAEPGARAGRVLGLFNSKHLSMVLDRQPHEPTLTEMAAFALERLSAGGSGFVLQIEGGRVDHAAHKNDAAGLVSDFREFDAAVAHVVEWVGGRSDTLLVITTDHATANPGSTFYGQRGIDGLRRLADAKHALEWAFAGVPAGPEASPARQAEVLAQRVREAVGVSLGGEAQKALARSMDLRVSEDNVPADGSVGVDPFSAQCVVECVLGSLLANELGVAFISPNHTSDHVELLALGAGAHTLPTFQDNTATHDWMTGLLQIARAPE